MAKMEHFASRRATSRWLLVSSMILSAVASRAHGSLLGDAGARALSVALGGYPKFTGRFSPLPGPRPVSFRRTRLGEDGCEAQILYPSKGGTGSRRGRYARREVPSGLADYSSMPRFLYRPLSARRHPCPEGGDLAEDARDGNPLPLVVFSHGLGGCAEMYTGLCASLASYGFVVVAIEHRDGSGCFARTVDGEFLPYRKYDGPKISPSNFTRELLVDYRAPFLRQRVDEVVQSIRHLMDEEGDVLGGVDKSRVHLLGHSFGAATMTLVAQQLEEDKRAGSDVDTAEIGTVALLDPWLTPLEDQALDKGVSRPLLHVLSRSWCEGPEFDATVRLTQAGLPNGHPAALYAARRAQHASFSDAPNFFPGFLTKKVGVRGKDEPLYATHGAVASLVGAAMRGEDIFGRKPGSDARRTMPTPEDADLMQALELLDLENIPTGESLVATR
uniref:1-alkyl-2-acetylglycerophosphocholine esterase n=1 Tax=Odontella aurita TaxID=265563 RepID=A0A7S4NDT3_9STRA|mmetsp:Transcript_59914/g.177645  ORF Transcript_59914/g.177645 Transcript_59914/m.177645 type:complete len:445 (+) Transcript_59914:202-1536(+)